ncbi:MAG: hypothetical protein HOP31_11275 [Ignavibacteria bacterium]|nr:hypothetical protein [Ignavibacteria bacterium]
MKTNQNENHDSKRKYFFFFVENAKVSSGLELTKTILSHRIENKSLPFDQETVKDIFNAIDQEIERLTDSKMKVFVNNAMDISASIKNVWISKNKITFNQFVCLFNILYGLSKCY